MNMESELRSLKSKVSSEKARRESSESHQGHKVQDATKTTDESDEGKGQHVKIEKGSGEKKDGDMMGSDVNRDVPTDSDDMVVIREAETSSTLFINNNSNSPTP